MCINCWNEIGAPKLMTPQTKRASKLIGELNPMAGGNLHIMTDDYNCTDSDLEFCQKAHKENIAALTGDEFWFERKLLDIFSEMSEEERVSAIAYHDGFWEE